MSQAPERVFVVESSGATYHGAVANVTPGRRWHLCAASDGAALDRVYQHLKAQDRDIMHRLHIATSTELPSQVPTEEIEAMFRRLDPLKK